MTTGYLSIFEDNINVSIRAEGPDSQIGDAFFDIKAGTDFAGYTYDELKARGGGPIELPKPIVTTDIGDR